MDVPEIRELVIECFNEILVARGADLKVTEQLIAKFAEDTVQDMEDEGSLWTYMKMSREEAKKQLLEFLRGS